jgi:hypothetical protein
MIIFLSLACFSPRVGKHVDYLRVYVSQRLLASRAALCQLFLGRDYRLPHALEHQIRWLMPRRFVNQVLEAHNGFTLRRHHARQVQSPFCHAEQFKQLLICVCLSTGFHKRYNLPTTLGVFEQTTTGLQH